MFISLEQIIQAKNTLAGVLVPTTLQYSKTFSTMSGNEVYMKPECLQKTGAFKLRGAYNKIANLTQEQKNRGIITTSSGNHGAATAYSAMLHGIKATVIMPIKHSPPKRAAI